MGTDTITTLVAMEAREGCRGIPDLEKRVRAAMAATRCHFLAPDDNTAFRAAVAAAITESEGDEKEVLVNSADALKKISAVLASSAAGVLVGLESVDNALTKKTVPLMKWWNESRA